jgi:hypothetical protein
MKCCFGCHTIREKGASIGLSDFCVLKRGARKMKAYREAYLSIRTFHIKSSELVLKQI